MPSFATRNLLICVVPTVIALLSVYWFRKKKKLKTNSPVSSNSQTVSPNKLETLSSVCSDSADTLSDASSFASPESSEKSLRTTKYSSTFADPVSNVVHSITNSTPSCELQHIGMDSDKVNFSVPCDGSVSKVLKDTEVINSVCDHHPGSENSVPVNATATTKDVSPQIFEKSRLTDMNGCSESPPRDCSQNVNQLSDVLSEKTEIGDYSAPLDATEAIYKIIDFYGKNPRIVENGSLHSITSTESAVSSQLSDNEKLLAVETDSNDSHSSVLDENSLSYVSDDSESRQPVEIKNKDSLSSVLDENSLLSSLCDESDKSGLSKLVDGKSNGSMKLPEEDELVSDLEAMSLVSNHVETKTVACLDSSGCQTPNSGNRCSSPSSPDGSVQKMENKLPDITDSIAAIPLLNLPIESSDISTTHSVESQRHSSESESVSKALASCDSSISVTNCVSSSVEESSKSHEPISDTSDNVNSTEACTSQVESSPANTDVVLTEPITCAGSTPETNERVDVDPEIPVMNIRGHLNMSLNCISANETSTQALNWDGRQNQVVLVSQTKADSTDHAGPKVPDNPSGQYVYEFELPQELCGRLIGKGGKHVKSIKDRSNANVYIKRHPYDPLLKLVVVEGNQPDVTDALDIIRRKYPLARYPMVTLVKTNMISPTNVLPESLQWSRLYFSYLLPSTRSYIFNSCVVNFAELLSICVTQLHLPEGASCDVILSSLVSAGHFFLQQPTHPTYPSLSTLDQCMSACYSQVDTPLLPHPVEPGVICAAPVLRGWYRAQVIYLFDNETDCGLKFVDYGGFSQAPSATLRQIRSDFMSLPFQASECYLANVRPVDPSEGWSAEATATFEELAQGQILQALLVEYAQDGIPCVHLYRVQGISSMFINKELVERGQAVWVNSSQWSPA